MFNRFSNRALILLGIFFSAACAAGLGYFAYGIALHTGNYLIKLPFSLGWNLLALLGLILAFLAFLCTAFMFVEGSISLARFYIKYLRKE
jgi:hypothetical protein